MRLSVSLLCSFSVPFYRFGVILVVVCNFAFLEYLFKFGVALFLCCSCKCACSCVFQCKVHICHLALFHYNLFCCLCVALYVECYLAVAHQHLFYVAGCLSTFLAVDEHRSTHGSGCYRHKACDGCWLHQLYGLVCRRLYNNFLISGDVILLFTFNSVLTGLQRSIPSAASLELVVYVYVGICVCYKNNFRCVALQGDILGVHLVGIV